MVIRTFFAAVASAAVPAFGQVIYEPLVTQYGGQSPYYYAGNDPQIHEAARFPHAEGAVWGRIPGYAFVSPRRQVFERRVRTFTDDFGTTDARPYGLTPDQVNNQANARLPRYFRKMDLLASGLPVYGGASIVPADAPAIDLPRGTILIRPAGPPHHRPRGPVFVFPRTLLERKFNDVVVPAVQRPA